MQNPDVDVDALAYSKKRKVVTFATFDDLENGSQVLRSSRAKKCTRRLQQKLPGYEVETVANDKAEDKFIVMASNDRTPGTRNLYDVKSKELTKLAEVAPWLKENQLAPMKPIEYKSRDGLTIHGYLTLAARTRGEKPSRSSSIRTADRGIATPGASIRKCNSLPTAATPFCR